MGGRGYIAIPNSKRHRRHETSQTTLEIEQSAAVRVDSRNPHTHRQGQTPHLSPVPTKPPRNHSLIAAHLFFVRIVLALIAVVCTEGCRRPSDLPCPLPARNASSGANPTLAAGSPLSDCGLVQRRLSRLPYL